jgi:hypothetical protein
MGWKRFFGKLAIGIAGSFIKNESRKKQFEVVKDVVDSVLEDEENGVEAPPPPKPRKAYVRKKKITGNEENVTHSVGE